MKNSVITLMLLSTSLLTGCFSLSGLNNASSDFACSPDLDPYCGSLASVHEKINTKPDTTTVVITPDGTAPERLTIDASRHTPKRAPESILRIWVAPFVDDEGDLIDEHVMFATVREARWAPETMSVKRSAPRRDLTPLSVPTEDAR